MAPPPNLRRTYAGRRVLITGGLGFIGSNLARALVGLGARVSIVDSLVPGLPRLDLAATEGKGAGWGERATVRHLRVFVSICVCM